MKKKLLLGTIAILFALMSVMFCSCEKNLEETGKKAGKEFCDCYQDNSLSYCEKKLKDKYSSMDYTDEDFARGFNEEGAACGVKWEIRTRKISSK